MDIANETLANLSSGEIRNCSKNALIEEKFKPPLKKRKLTLHNCIIPTKKIAIVYADVSDAYLFK